MTTEIVKEQLDKVKSQAIEHMTFAVLGAGHGGLAMAGHLGLMGFNIRLWNRSFERIRPVKIRGGISISGDDVHGFGRVRMITNDIGEAVSEVDVVMVAVPAIAHAEIARRCAPFLHDGQIVILNPGRTGGALEFVRVLREENIQAYPIVTEAQTFLYASRALGPAEAKIFRMKNSVPLATLPCHWIPDVIDIIRPAFPQFVPGDNVLKTSLDNIGAVFHPALTVMNAGWIEETYGDFEYYMQGVTPSISKILEKVDAERVAVAGALGIRGLTAREWLYLAYDAVGKDLFQAMHDNPGYRGIMAPDKLAHRYIEEDVPMSLVPISSMGDMLNIPTPTMKSIIQMASLMHERDYFSEGRNVERMGIAGLTIQQIRLLCVQGWIFEGSHEKSQFEGKDIEI